MSDQAQQLSDQIAGVVVLMIKSALAPLQAEIAVLKALQPDAGTLRERVAVLETRAPVPGPPGPAGTDGFTCDELTLTQDDDDERILTLGFRKGTIKKTLGQLRLAFPRYCGTYDSARVYTKGDQVTHAGGLWTCHEPTRSRPGTGEDGWTLQVKRGDGR